MSDQQRGQVVTVSPARAFQEELDSYAPSFAQALPAHVSVEKFKRVLLTAVSQNPDLFYANRRTLFTAAVRCASDGLLPDGREAALVVYNTKVKRRDPQTGLDREETIKAAQFLPMVAGIRKRMRNSGDVVSAIAEVVHKNDRFEYRLGDEAMIRHEPPPLGEDRGEAVGAYAIIKLKSGETIRDVMPRKDIEAARNQGRAKDSLMWTKFWGEGAKKTVLRRCAKSAPQSAEIEALLDRDDEAPMLGMQDLAALPAPGMGPEPECQDFIEKRQPEPEPEPQFAVIDLDGVVNTFGSANRAYDAMRLVLGEASRDSLARLDGVWESNEPLIDAFEASGNPNLSREIVAEYADIHNTRVETDRRSEASKHAVEQSPPSRPTTPPPAAGHPGADAKLPAEDRGPVEDTVSRRGDDPKPSAELQRGPLASVAAPPSEDTSKSEQAPSAPPPATTPAVPTQGAAASGTAASSAQAGTLASATQSSNNGPTATSAASPSERPFPGDMPAAGRPATADELRGNAAAERSDPGKLGGQPAPAATAGERKSVAIPLPLKQGKPDLRTWAVALVGPKMRRIRLSNDLADFLGDNAQTLEACRAPGALAKDDLADLEQCIKDQWRLVEPG